MAVLAVLATPLNANARRCGTAGTGIADQIHAAVLTPGRHPVDQLSAYATPW